MSTVLKVKGVRLRLNCRLILKNVFLGLFVVVGILIGQPGRAQSTDRAITLQVMFSGVEFQRAGTQVWLQLPVGAVSPMGPGDRIRTGENGRVRLSAATRADVLVMPSSDYRLIAYDGTTWQAEMTGFVVHRVLPSLEVFDLQAEDMAISTSSGVFATWTTDPDTPTIAVASGTAMVAADNTSIDIAAGEGFRPGYQQLAVMFEAQPYNEARLIALVSGCLGVVDTVQDDDLLVRNGTHFDALSMGALPDGSPVDLLGVSDSGLRFRVQYLSDFGWVESLAVETNCDDLPVYPTPYREFFRTVTNATPSELELLTPFYGPPLDDPWFYRFTSDAARSAALATSRENTTN